MGPCSRGGKFEGNNQYATKELEVTVNQDNSPISARPSLDHASKPNKLSSMWRSHGRPSRAVQSVRMPPRLGEVLLPVRTVRSERCRCNSNGAFTALSLRKNALMPAGLRP